MLFWIFHELVSEELEVQIVTFITKIVSHVTLFIIPVFVLSYHQENYMIDLSLKEKNSDTIRLECL